MIVVMKRHHANGGRAEVRLLENGGYYSSCARQPGEALATQRRSRNTDLERARIAADQYAHPACDGRECGRWQLVASVKDDAVLLHRMYPDLIDSAGLAERETMCPKQHAATLRLAPMEWVARLTDCTIQFTCNECGASFVPSDEQRLALLEEFRHRGF